MLQPFCTACAAQDAGRDDDRRRRLDRARGTPRSLVRPKGAASGERATDSPLGGRDDVDSEDDIVGCRSLLGGAAGDRGLPGGAPAAALRPTPVEAALERATGETDLHGLVLAIDRARDDGVSLSSPAYARAVARGERLLAMKRARDEILLCRNCEDVSTLLRVVDRSHKAGLRATP